jgi:hypothetical protein
VEDKRWGLYSSASPVLRQALHQMDQWLTALAADTSRDGALTRIQRARPADLSDACWTRDQHPEKIVERQMYGSGRCEQLYPSASFPRGVAGAPIAADVIKCQLRPIAPADYKVTFTPAERSRLKTIFPDGVCDWTKAGVGQEKMTTTWHRFATTSD